MLTPDDQALLGTTLLPTLERHFLSLLVHGLRTFQAIAATSDAPEELPDRLHIEAWVARQPPLAEDPGFQAAFVEQLCRLRDPLLTISIRDGQAPLDLRVETLVAWVREQADARLNGSAITPPAAGPIPPPG
ncbi:MAG: hypothetical protein VKO39_11520 [Cyanobacteriota bacterium]|nr:hypothetical protein [Cyanobacteriota bacterium]